MSLIAGGVSSGVQGLLGMGQLIGGSSMRPKRPTYQIPKEISNMLALRQMNLRGRMAGASYAEQNILQSQANTVGRYQNIANNPNAILAGVSASQGQANRGFQGLAVTEAQDYQRRLGGLEGAQRTMAGYRDRAFDINEMQPFQDEARTKAALIGAGLRNTTGGVQGAAGMLQDYAGYDLMKDFYGMGRETPATVQQPDVEQPDGTEPSMGTNDFGLNIDEIPAGMPQMQTVTPQTGTGQYTVPPPTPQEGSTGFMGVEGLKQGSDFAGFIRKKFGTSITNLNPMQLMWARQLFQNG